MTSFTLSSIPEIRFGAGRLADIAPLAEARAERAPRCCWWPIPCCGASA